MITSTLSCAPSGETGETKLEKAFVTSRILGSISSGKSRIIVPPSLVTRNASASDSRVAS